VSATIEGMPPRPPTPADVIAGVRIAGSATFVAEVVAEDAQALVY